MADEKPEETQQPYALDWFLQGLINLVNNPENSSLEIGITVLAGGLLVSGYLVNGARYFEGFASDFVTIFPPDSAEGVRSSLSSYGDIYKGEQDTLPMFIHLKDARFFSTAGNPIPANRGVWWRGRVSEVSGFMIGTLGGPR